MAQGTEGLRSKQGQAFQRQRLQGPHPARGQGRREGELAPGPGARLTGGGWTPTPICGSGCPQVGQVGEQRMGKEEPSFVLCTPLAPTIP